MDEDAIRRGVPERLVPGSDVLRMSRAVRLLGRVRRPQADSAEETEPARRERAYVLAADRDAEGGAPPQPWEQVAAGHNWVVVGDPGMGKSWLIRAETHWLAIVARRDLADTAGRAVIQYRFARECWRA